MRKIRLVACTFFMLCVVLHRPVYADLTGADILNANVSSILYLEVVNREKGVVVETATGVIVSYDGYVITAGHVHLGPNQVLRAHIGQAGGAFAELEFQQNLYAIDPVSKSGSGVDLALYRFPTAPGCDQAVWMARELPQPTEALWVMGFRGKTIIPHLFSVTNPHGPEGIVLADGTLDVGESGGPVFNSEGAVVGFVAGGHLASGKDQAVTPIRLAVPLLERAGQWPPPRKEERFPAACFNSCPNPANGVERWSETKPWEDNSGWLGGGNNPQRVCDGLARGYEQSNAGWSVVVSRTGESSRSDIFRQFQYIYYCSGEARRGPVFASARSAACGMNMTRR